MINWQIFLLVSIHLEKHVTRVYFTVLIIGILYAVFAAFSFHINIDTRAEGQEAAVWDSRMEETQEDGIYYYKCTLPVENINEKVIVYNTVHMYLEVLIGGDKVYELKSQKGSAVRTTGVCWNTIFLTEADAGKEIIFQVTPVYKDS